MKTHGQIPREALGNPIFGVLFVEKTGRAQSVEYISRRLLTRSSGNAGMRHHYCALYPFWTVFPGRGTCSRRLRNVRGFRMRAVFHIQSIRFLTRGYSIPEYTPSNLGHSPATHPSGWAHLDVELWKSCLVRVSPRQNFTYTICIQELILTVLFY